MFFGSLHLCSGYEKGRRVGRDCLVDPLLLPSFLSERTSHSGDSCPPKGSRYPYVLVTNLSLTSHLCLYSSSGSPFTCDLSPGEGRNLLFSSLPPKETKDATKEALPIVFAFSGFGGLLLLVSAALYLASYLSNKRKKSMAGRRILLRVEADGMEEVVEVDPKTYSGRV